jgi:hypothetical protein
VAAVGLQTIPTRCSASLLCASPSPQTDNLSQCRLNPFDLICHFELSDHASVTCLSICLGIPVLHARILRTQPAYSTIDQWADFLLNDSAHAFRSRHASQDKLAYILAQANLASSAGVYSSAACWSASRGGLGYHLSWRHCHFCWWSLLPFSFRSIFLSYSARH